VDEDELRAIASQPDYFLFASNFTQLTGVLQQRVVNISCREAATLPPPTNQGQ